MVVMNCMMIRGFEMMVGLSFNFVQVVHGLVIHTTDLMPL